MDYYDLQVDKIIERAVEEDLGWGDVTTDNLIPEGAVAVATLATRQSGIACGIQVALKVFQKVDRDLSGKLLFRDGQEIHPGDVILEIEGHAASILRAERVALNFVQRMSGIATETARYVEAVRGLPV
ncbi:MAG: nicotinate-nucleotide diphosphorylase (carboxylating), partial [Chloroflexi bacterium]|nr:nicotinate-nucleotide diphosphorylase (carboxylating) [Chloroflexota bacterium]